MPPDRLPCPRCAGLGHLAPGQIRGVCQGTWWDMTVDPPLQRACGQPIPEHEWREGERRCASCSRQATRLAGLAQPKGGVG